METSGAMPGLKIPYYECPGCRNVVRMNRRRGRKRKRHCPSCGELITPEEFERQDEARREEERRKQTVTGVVTICVIAVGLIVLLVFLMSGSTPE
jgi:predicted nucleic acid-binding Zn ribbon protein